MQNRVGHIIPSDQEIQQLVKDIESLGAKIQKFRHGHLGAAQDRLSLNCCVRT